MPRSENVDDEEEEVKPKTTLKNKTNDKNEKRSRRNTLAPASLRKIENPSITGPSRLKMAEKTVANQAASHKQKKSNGSKSDQPNGRSKTGIDLSKDVAPAMPSKNTTLSSKPSNPIASQTQKQRKASKSDLPGSTQGTGTSHNKVVKFAMSGPATSGVATPNAMMGELVKPTDSTRRQAKPSKHSLSKGTQKTGTLSRDISKPATPGSSGVMATLSGRAKNKSKPGTQQRVIGSKCNSPKPGKHVTVISGQATTTIDSTDLNKEEKSMLANKLAGVLSEGVQATLDKYGITAKDVKVYIE